MGQTAVQTLALRSQGGAGGDYKQYMDYSKYTQGQGAQGGSDYKKYMDYSKYTQGAKANDANSESPALLAAPKSSDEGSFVRDYKNYMQQRGKNVSAGFEKYMKTHAGEFKHYVQSRGAEAAGDFDDYFKNYKSFFQNEGKDAAGDFQKFVNEYASDYAKYLKACEPACVALCSVRPLFRIFPSPLPCAALATNLLKFVRAIATFLSQYALSSSLPSNPAGTRRQRCS